jgi:Lar family restriction alleviation protein
MNIETCPFCGSKKVELCGTSVDLDKDKYIDGHAVFCNKCGARGAVHKLQTKAVSLWNTASVAMQERINELLERHGDNI